MHDYRVADLEPRVRCLCDFAVKVTREPSGITVADVDVLRGEGWSDAAIHDALQVVSYFNYINRIADAVGIERRAGVGASLRNGPHEHVVEANVRSALLRVDEELHAHEPAGRLVLRLGDTFPLTKKRSFMTSPSRTHSARRRLTAFGVLNLRSDQAGRSNSVRRGF